MPPSVLQVIRATLMARVTKTLNRVIFVLLLALVITANIPYGTVDAWWQAAFECSVFAITALWLIEVALKGRWELRNAGLLLPLVLIVAYAFIQIAPLPSWMPGAGSLAQSTLTIDRYQTYLTARKALVLVLFLGILLAHTTSPRRLNWVIRTLIVVGVSSAVFGILRQLLQSKTSEEGFVLPFLFYATGYGQYLYHNLFAYLMEMVIAVLAGLLLGGGVRRERVPFYLAMGLLMWAAMVLSLSRGAVLGFTCLIVFVVFVSLTWYSASRLASAGEGEHALLRLIHSRALRFVFIGLMIGGLIVGVFWMGGEDFSGRLLLDIGTHEPIDRLSRPIVWRSTWELIKHQPWTGVGFGAYFLAIPQYQGGAGRFKLEEAHNDYLDLMANGGIVAVALAGWFVVLLLNRVRKIFRSTDVRRRAACLGAIAGILGIGVHSLVDFGLQITGIAVVFLVLVTIAVADESVELTQRRRWGENLPRPRTITEVKLS
jgi:O-antigen ligase